MCSIKMETLTSKDEYKGGMGVGDRRSNARKRKRTFRMLMKRKSQVDCCALGLDDNL